MHFIPSSLKAQFSRYGQFTDMGANIVTFLFTLGRPRFEIDSRGQAWRINYNMSMWSKRLLEPSSLFTELTF